MTSLKALTPAVLLQLADEHPAHRRPWIMSGALKSIGSRDGSTYVRADARVADLPARVTRSLGGEAGAARALTEARASAGLVAMAAPVATTEPQSDLITRGGAPGRASQEAIDRAKLDPSVTLEQFRSMLGVLPAAVESAAPEVAVLASLSREEQHARIERSWRDERPARPAPVSPATTTDEKICRAWDEADGTPADHARLANEREKRAAAIAKKTAPTAPLTEKEREAASLNAAHAWLKI